MKQLHLDILDWLCRQNPDGRRYSYAEIARELGCSTGTVYLTNRRSGQRPAAGWRWQNLKPVRADVVEMLKPREDGTVATFTEIGNALGVSREWIRQLAFKLGIKGRQRIHSNTQLRRERKQAERKWPRGPYFVMHIRRWLREIESDYCSCCHGAPLVRDMVANNRRCKPCQAERTLRAYHAQDGRYRKAAKEWVQRNPERVRKYYREYAARKREASRRNP